MRGDGSWAKTAKYGDILQDRNISPSRYLMYLHPWPGSNHEFAGAVLNGFDIDDEDWSPGFIWRGTNFNWEPVE